MFKRAVLLIHVIPQGRLEKPEPLIIIYFFLAV